MKSLIIASLMILGLQAHAQYDIQKFPGRVDIQVDPVDFTGAAKPIDILFVIDNSGSMTSYQNQIASLTPIFVNAISSMKRDFHVGVISTDGDTGFASNHPGYLISTPLVIDAQTPDLKNSLARSFLVGTNGSPIESPFSSLTLALSEPLLSGYNNGFLRSNAVLALVFLTDAEDQSTMSADETLNFLKNLKGDLNSVSAFSWIVPSSLGDSTSCRRDELGVLPKKIESLTSSLNGEIYSICDMNPSSYSAFADKLAKFGAGNGSAGLREIPLTVTPDTATITVTYGTQTLVGGDIRKGWTYDSTKNAIVLGSEIVWSSQPAGTKLKVSFVPKGWQK